MPTAKASVTPPRIAAGTGAFDLGRESEAEGERASARIAPVAGGGDDRLGCAAGPLAASATPPRIAVGTGAFGCGRESETEEERASARIAPVAGRSGGRPGCAAGPVACLITRVSSGAVS